MMMKAKRMGIQAAMDEFIESLSAEEREIFAAKVYQIEEDGGDILDAFTTEQLDLIDFRADFIDYTGLTFEEAMLVSDGNITNLPKEYLSKMLEMSVVNEEEYDWGHCPLCIDWATGERYCHCKLCHPEDPYWPGGDHHLISKSYDEGEFNFLVRCCIEHHRGETEGSEYCYREILKGDIDKFLETFGDPKTKSKEFYLEYLNQYPPKHMYFTDKKSAANGASIVN